MQEALPRLLQDTHITALIQGNFTAQDAFEMASSARKAMSNGILLASERSADRVVVLPTGALLHRWTASAAVSCDACQSVRACSAIGVHLRSSQQIHC